MAYIMLHIGERGTISIIQLMSWCIGFIVSRQVQRCILLVGCAATFPLETMRRTTDTTIFFSSDSATHSISS